MERSQNEYMIATGKAKTPKAMLAQRLLDGITIASRHLRNIELPRGLTRERLVVLATINEYGQSPVSDLAGVLQVKVPTISRMISALEDDGLVSRKKSNTDGRGILVSLTAKGRRVYQQANRQSLSGFSKALGELTDTQIAALSALAIKLESLSIDSDCD
jgi:DNA-binding MarR family transcriptional regulator